MWNRGEEMAHEEGPQVEAMERVVFARGAWSILMTGDAPVDEAPREGRALPDLLRQRWAIRATVATGDGTYFILKRPPDEPAPPSSVPASSVPSSGWGNQPPGSG